MILNLEGIKEAAVVAKEETTQNKIKNKETLIELLNECLRSKPTAINVLDTYTYITEQTEIKLSTMIRLGDMSMFMDSEWRTCKKNGFYATKDFYGETFKIEFFPYSNELVLKYYEHDIKITKLVNGDYVIEGERYLDLLLMSTGRLYFYRDFAYHFWEYMDKYKDKIFNLGKNEKK